MMYKFVIILSLIISTKSQAQPPKVQFDHVGLPVKNLDSSIAFYSGLFALDTIKNPFPGARVRWYLLGGDIQFHLIESPAGKTDEPLFQHLCLSIHSIEEFMKTLKNKNIPYYNGQHVINEINVRGDGVKQLFIQDPDGYWIEVNNHMHH